MCVQMQNYFHGMWNHSFNAVQVNSIVIIVFLKSKWKENLAILSCIRDQRIKKQETREQLKSSETKEIAYTLVDI